MSKPGDPPEQFYTTAQTPPNPAKNNAPRCVACHVLSRDGTTMAVTYDGGDQSATVLDVATRTPYMPPDAYYWNFATFTPDGSKLLVVHQGTMTLIDPKTGMLLNRCRTPASRPTPTSRPTATRSSTSSAAPAATGRSPSGVIVTQSYDPRR